ncbi:hypothetical protein [Mucilaginibacter agri]|uniref:Uncharacterized protein n=1 Tax=Mucilaginibacter agri TaxID=2695265 RepID=A0A965ZK70_9SPHI|nr:hypothetical protein [Mucilaginibacter agri]NCD71547.1 hypothetical protein [Mucilaginibacter agri]
MFLGYNGCRITIEDDLIRCSYGSPYNTRRWQITLTDTEICFTSEGKKKRVFKIDEIKEFQFEMGNGAIGRSYKDIPAAFVYIILNPPTWRKYAALGSGLSTCAFTIN